ncbi:Fc.00g024520.m01.CDS01 [Cosmosporella sp. VM-42]
MTSPIQLPLDFQSSYQDRDRYPCNYTHRSIGTYPSALAGFLKKLDLAAVDLCEKNLDNVEVSFRDLNGEGTNVSKRNIHTPECLTEWLGVERILSSNVQEPQVGLTPERKDPKCRFIYISSPHSRARLRITRSMLTEILTFHQVMPDYLDFLFVFGLQSEPEDLRFSSFREQTSLSKACSSLGIECLARSGRQYQLCYNLKGVTAKYQDEQDRSNNVYSIRQAAFYHRLDIVNGNALWIVSKGGLDIYGRFKELTGKQARPEDKSFGTAEECFRSSLSAHLLFCHWSTEDWRGYIKWLEYIVDKETKMAILGPTGSGYHHRIYTAGDIQKLLELEERANEVITMLDSNVEVMDSLKRFYEKLAVNKNFDLQECNDDIDVFANQMNNMIGDFRLQIGRTKALVKMLSDRTELVKQHRLERLNRNMEKEAIVVRIVTIVTLIYLPATFVSTLFSTDIIKYQGQDSPKGNFSLVAMERWLQVTLPLTFMTLGVAYLSKRWAEEKVSPQTQNHEAGDADLGADLPERGRWALKGVTELFVLVERKLDIIVPYIRRQVNMDIETVERPTLPDTSSSTSQGTSQDCPLERFRLFLQTKEVCRRNFENKPFYHPKSIKRWMSDTAPGNEAHVSNAKLLLGAVFPKQFVPVWADQIVPSHSLVFAILLDIGCGRMIGVFRRYIRDATLKITDLSKLYDSISNAMPMEGENLPAEYEEGGYPAVMAKFESRRWAFVSDPLPLEMDDMFIHGKSILPFFHMKAIKEGGTAEVYHCKIQADMVEPSLAKALKPSKGEVKDDVDFGKYYEFAVKSYKAKYSNVYRWESNAFRGFRGQKGLGVVKYLGEYRLSDGQDTHTHHIMLEYGEQDLDEYLADALPPVLTGEIISTWESLFKVANTLERIHQLNHEGEDGNMRIFKGWHGDIKPDNILHVRGEFKLADFGFSKFEEHDSETCLIGGTRHYGAPEREIKFDGPAKPQSQTIDTWSFGCVLSAVATWVILGSYFYESYDKIREDAILELKRRHQEGEDISIPDCDDAFHDGKKVLPTVLEWHNHLRNCARRSDTISSRILDLVDDGMLVDAERRLTSAQFCEKLAKITELARSDYQNQLVDRSLKKESDEILDALLKLDQHAPITATPLSQASTSLSVSELPQDPGSSQALLGPFKRFPSKRVRKSDRFSRIVAGKTANREQVIKAATRMSTLDETSEQHVNPSQSSISSTQAIPDVDSKSPSSRSGKGKEVDVSETHRPTSPRVPMLREPEDQVTLTATPEAPGTFPVVSPVEAPTQPISYPNPQSNQREALSLSVDVPAGPQSSDSRSLEGRPHNDEGRSLSRPPEPFPQPPHPSVPRISNSQPLSAIEEEYEKLTKQWGEAKTWNVFRSKVPKNTFLETHIQDRDIKFVVDNATSMAPHWAYVEKTVLALAMKIGPLDEDGLDLVYANGRRHALTNVSGWKIRPKFQESMKRAHEHIRSMEEPIHTDMSTTLSKIFDEYKNVRRKQTLIILTDGLWEGSNLTDDVEKKICAFVAGLKGKLGKLEPRWFSIQFISFGNDEAALNRLQALDDHLETSEDVVDTKPWDFPDVNKLVLGSITQEGDEATESTATPTLSPPTEDTPPLQRASSTRSRIKSRMSGIWRV